MKTIYHDYDESLSVKDYGNIKRKIRTPIAPLTQISRKISEGYRLSEGYAVKVHIYRAMKPLLKGTESI